MLHLADIVNVANAYASNFAVAAIGVFQKAVAVATAFTILGHGR